MNLWSAIAAALGAIVAIAVSAFLIAGPERIWSLAGPPDLGPVDFAQLRRRDTPNDALICPKDVCRAKSDAESPVFATTAHDLRTAFRKVIASEPRVTLVAAGDATLTDRYIQRSALFGFPDTIVVRFFDLPGGNATLALYSRSQLGWSDLGVNRARLLRWIEKLTGAAPRLR